jgi:hypothetical protein
LVFLRRLRRLRDNKPAALAKFASALLPLMCVSAFNSDVAETHAGVEMKQDENGCHN